MLILRVRPSRRYRWAHGVAHLLAAVALGWAALPLTVQCLGLLALAGHLLWRRLPGERRLRCGDDGQLAVASGDTWQSVTLCPDSQVLPWLIVLRYRPAQARYARTLPILGDSLPPEDFRRLRVWLRWRARLA